MQGKYLKIGPDMESSFGRRNLYIQLIILQKLCQLTREFFRGGNIEVRVEDHGSQAEGFFRQLPDDERQRPFIVVIS